MDKLGSLRARLVLTAALLLGAAAAAPLFVLPGRLESRDLRDEERRAMDVALALAGAAGVAVDFGDRVRAAEVLSAVEQLRDPVFGRLRGPDGAVLATWGTAPGVEAEPDLGAGPFVRKEDGLLHVAVPVPTRSGQRGVLELGLGLQGLERRRAEARGLVVVTAGVVFLAGLVMALGLFSLLVRPLERVTEVARRIAGGEEAAARHLDVAGGGEAGAVASALGGVVEQLVSQRAVLEAQNEASSDGILVLGLDGRVLVHNRRLGGLLSLAGESLVGASWPTVRDLLARSLPGGLPAWLAAPAPALPGSRPSVDDLLLGDGRHVELHAAPVRASHGEVIGTCLTFRDVTAERQAAARIRNLNAELEARVAIRTGELARANEELGDRVEELQRTRDQLIQADRAIAIGRLAAGVAHEINNPLAYVVANLRYVQENLPAACGQAGGQPGGAAPSIQVEELQQALQEAAEGTGRVARIVRDLKAYSRPATEQRTATGLEAAMEAALSMASPELRPRAAVVRAYMPAPPALADPVRLSQVFLNLLLNAAQAIPEGAAERHQVTVTVGCGADGWPFAEVRDTGPGIPEDAVGKIFDPFFTTKPQGQGSGLGLAVSMGIVTNLNGRIEVRSRPGEGATFRVVLPPAELAAEPPAGPALTPPPRPGRLLVLDDEPIIGAAVRRMFRGTLEVEVATDPGAALARIQAGQRYDHILCDLMMPVMSGMDFEAALRATAPDQAARMIFMTGGVYTDAAVAFVRLHGDRCLDKPLDLDKLRSALHANHQG
jgi:signal transduction histidine kinase/CheY-like chemotaxis protein